MAGFTASILLGLDSRYRGMWAAIFCYAVGSAQDFTSGRLIEVGAELVLTFMNLSIFALSFCFRA